MEDYINSDSINILVVDDDARMRETLNDLLSGDGYKIAGADTIASAKEEIGERFYNVVLVDLKLPDGTGLDLLREIKKISKETAVIVLTGFASLESSVSSLNEGAFAYIQKPVNIDELRIFIKRALDMQKLYFDNKKLLNRLKELNLKDAHTGLYNYKYLIERLTLELKRAKRHNLYLSVVMLDIDYFESINDTYGHQYADKLLKEFACFLKNFVRESDVVFRYGSEEFVIILLDTDREHAAAFGERMLNTAGKYIFDPGDKRIRLKVSIGISGFPEDGNNVDTLLNSADKALSKAKEKGGNRLAFRNIDSNAKDITDENDENIDGLRKKLIRMAGAANQAFLESIYAFAKAIEARDHYTGEHTESTVSIAAGIGKKLNLSKEAIENLKHAAALHDLGKIGIPDSILNKKGKLTEEEYEKIKKHPQIGAEILRVIHFLKDIVPLILYHHERYDGTGYPIGLKGEEIPLGARIVTVADVYQALISDRPYRKAYSKEEALKIIEEGSGTQFDPDVVKALIEIIRTEDNGGK